MNEQFSLTDWLAQKPLPEEIKFNDDGSSYIPIEFIKPKLDYLSTIWSTVNFKHTFYNSPDGKLWCSASVELHLTMFRFQATSKTIGGGDFVYESVKEQRILSGSATFDVQKYYPNTNWGQTALSLCIVAAAKELGIFFGKELNKEMLTMPTVSNGKKDKKVNKLTRTINQLDVKKS